MIMDISNWKGYERKLIQLRPDVVLMMHLFYRQGRDNLESAFLGDNEKYYEADYNVIEESAHQFMQQLEGNTCIAFLEALKKEIEKELEKEYKIRNTANEN